MNSLSIFNELQPIYKDKLVMSTDTTAFIITQNQLIALLSTLKTHYGFNLLALLTAVDYPDHYQMVYHLMSLKSADMVTIHVDLSKTSPKVPSIVSLWSAANVQEREVYDMFGITFDGHPYLKRILNPDDFTEFPLRKSFVLKSIDRQSLS